MQSLLTHLTAGTALYGELGELMVVERGALARHDLAAVERANVRRKDVLEAIAEWEAAALDCLGEAPSGDGAPTLGAAVRALPPPERPRAEAALAALKDAAEAARGAAAVNHILVERSLDTVTHTLDILTGRPSRLTYGPRGGVTSGGAGGLVTRTG